MKARSAHEALRAWQAEQGLSDTELAAALGMSAANLSRIFTLERPLGVGAAIRCQDLTGIPAAIWHSWLEDYRIERVSA